MSLSCDKSLVRCSCMVPTTMATHSLAEIGLIWPQRAHARQRNYGREGSGKERGEGVALGLLIHAKPR